MNKNKIYTKNKNKCIKNSILFKEVKKYDTNNLNEFSNNFILPLLLIYKSFNFENLRNTFYYFFNYFKNGIIIHINNNKLKSFTYFNNEYYYNPFLKYLSFNKKDEKQLIKLEKIKKSKEIDKYFKLEKKNKEFVKLYVKDLKLRNNPILERRNWVLDGYYFINSKYEDIEKNYTFLYKYFFQEYVKFTSNENLLFFLNLRNYPIFTKNNNFPLDNIVKDYKIPFDLNFPILSLYTSDKYNDIPIPLPWDLRYIFDDILFPNVSCNFINKHKLEFKWENKVNKLCFRGYVVGDGYNRETNVRIKAYEIGLENSDLLDIGILNYRKRLKKNKDKPLVFMNTTYFTNILNDYEQSFYKYILVLEGHFYSSSLSFKLHMKSCILLQESENELWFSNLLVPYKHYIPIKNDLSDLVKKVSWCIKNDNKCERIAENGYRLIKSILTKDYIFNYINKILNKKCIIKFQRNIKIKNKIGLIITHQSNKSNNKSLKKLLEYYDNIHPYIDKYIIEQTNKHYINYGILKNIGYDIIKNKNYDYFIFTNVNYIPDDELCPYLYDCKNFPLCLGTRGGKNEYYDPNEYIKYYENKNNKKYLEQNVSNLICFDVKSFTKLNGYPNQFFGLSGEHIILLIRIYLSKLKLYYPKKGRLINNGNIKKRVINFKKINDYISNKDLQKDGLYDIKKYYNILYVKDNHFKVDILKINNNSSHVKLEGIKNNILNQIKKIKCIYI